jgi:hypothetical protein
MKGVFRNAARQVETFNEIDDPQRERMNSIPPLQASLSAKGCGCQPGVQRIDTGYADGPGGLRPPERKAFWN